jgi:hypothetical protein
MKKKVRILKSHYSYGGYFVQTKAGFFSLWKYVKDCNGFIILFSTAMEAEDHIEKLLKEDKNTRK